MYNIPFHIAYLLTRYKYVAVPGLGAFIVSPSNNERTSRWGIFSPPQNTLRFSSEIERNDGLLANSIAKREKCSVEKANQMIVQYVTQLLHSLEEGKGVYIPLVGSLFSSNNKKLFQPEMHLSCNALNYGLTSFSMPSIKDIQFNETQPKKKVKKNKVKIGFPNKWKIIIFTATLIAALIALLIVLYKQNDANFFLHQAKPAILIQPSTLDSIDEKTNISDTIAIQTPVEPMAASAEPISSPPETKAEPQKTAPVSTSVKTITPYYYIIINSSLDIYTAKKKLAELQSKGFKDADIISSNGRHRIYSNFFEDKAEAEKFLIQFKKDYPAYSDAWLLTQAK